MIPKVFPYRDQGCRPAGLLPMSRRGQATTEVVLLFPIFMFFLFAFAKIFAMLILVQKMEIASFYAARRWQLESHRNVEYEADDSGALQDDIEKRVSEYIGFGGPTNQYGDATEKFLDLVRLTGHGAQFRCERTQVWNICTLEVKTRPFDIAMMYHSPGFDFKVTKYVPNRDRPIAFVLPGLQN